MVATTTSFGNIAALREQAAKSKRNAQSDFVSNDEFIPRDFEQDHEFIQPVEEPAVEATADDGFIATGGDIQTQQPQTQPGEGNIPTPQPPTQPGGGNIPTPQPPPGGGQTGPRARSGLPPQATPPGGGTPPATTEPPAPASPQPVDATGWQSMPGSELDFGTPVSNTVWDVTSEQLVQSQFASIMDSGNPAFQVVQEQIKRAHAAAGGQNSAMAARGAVMAMAEVGFQIALADAQTFARSAEFNAMMANQFGLAEQAFRHNALLSEQNFQQGKAMLWEQHKTVLEQITADMHAKAYLIDAELGAQLQLSLQNHQQALEAMDRAFGHDLSRMAVDQQYTIDRMGVEQGHVLERMGTEQGFMLERMSAEQNNALQRMDNEAANQLFMRQAEFGWNQQLQYMSEVGQQTRQLMNTLGAIGSNPNLTPAQANAAVAQAINQYNATQAQLRSAYTVPLPGTGAGANTGGGTYSQPAYNYINFSDYKFNMGSPGQGGFQTPPASPAPPGSIGPINPTPFPIPGGGGGSTPPGLSPPGGGTNTSGDMLQVPSQFIPENPGGAGGGIGGGGGQAQPVHGSGTQGGGFQPIGGGTAGAQPGGTSAGGTWNPVSGLWNPDAGGIQAAGVLNTLGLAIPLPFAGKALNWLADQGIFGEKLQEMLAVQRGLKTDNALKKEFEALNKKLNDELMQKWYGEAVNEGVFGSNPPPLSQVKRINSGPGHNWQTIATGGNGAWGTVGDFIGGGGGDIARSISAEMKGRMME